MEKQEITLSQSNLLTQARYDFTKVEKRAIYFIIQEVRRQHVINPDGQKTLYDNLVLQIDTEKLKGTDTVLRDVYVSLKRLRKKSVWIENEDKVLEVGYINYFEHIKHNSHLEVEVSKKILPYLVELAKEFTTYSLAVALTLKTKYAQRFYEYCSQYKNTGFMYLEIHELRKQMMLEEKYPRYKQLQSRVINVAQKELEEFYHNGESDLYFKYTEERYGRTVKALKIFIITRESEQNALAAKTSNDMASELRFWLNIWLDCAKKPKNKAFVDLVIRHIKFNADLIPQLYDRMKRLKEKNNAESLGAMARHIIMEDYLPQQTTLVPEPKDIEPFTEEDEKQALKDIERLKSEL